MEKVDFISCTPDAEKLMLIVLELVIHKIKTTKIMLNF